MSIKFNNAELDKMRGLRHECIVLYLRIRERMDYSCGLVGARAGCGVSWQGLREDLYIEPHTGIKSGSPGKEALRRMAVVLEKSGLIVNRSIGKRLIFLCVLADADYSAQNKPDTNPTRQTDIQADTLKASKHAGFSVVTNTQADTPKTAQADTHPVSGKNSHSHGRALIADDWQPAGWVNGRLRLAACPPYEQTQVLSFVCFHQERKTSINKNFDLLFVKWAADDHRRYGQINNGGNVGAKSQGTKQGGQAGNRGAYAEIREAARAAAAARGEAAGRTIEGEYLVGND